MNKQQLSAKVLVQISGVAGIALILLLAACDASSQPASTNLPTTVAQATPASLIPSPTQPATQTISAEEATNIALKLYSEGFPLTQDAEIVATLTANYLTPTRIPPTMMPDPPTPVITPGVAECPEPQGRRAIYRPVSCWYVFVNNQRLYLMSVAPDSDYRGSDAQVLSLLFVYDDPGGSLTAKPGEPNGGHGTYHYAPLQVGPLNIVSQNGNLLTLVPANPNVVASFIFDVSSRQYVSFQCGSGCPPSTQTATEVVPTATP